jgi:L-proline---[L-prolyl-carrier protein] ligase
MLTEIHKNLETRGSWPALVYQHSAVSYAELARMVIRLREEIKDYSPTSPLAIYGDKSPPCIAAILAAWSLGRIVLPLDPRSPLKKREQILSVSGAKLLSDNNLPAKGLSSGDLGEGWIDGPQPALILSTSGSTGEPKLVWFSMKAIGSFVDWGTKTLSFSEKDRVPTFASLSFDMSELEIWGALAKGGSVLIPPAGIASFPASLHNWLSNTEASLLYLVPSTVSQLSLVDSPLPHLRCLAVAGDRFPARAVQALSKRNERLQQVWNFYGPTETNVCLAHQWNHQEEEKTPIGLPLPGTTIVILDDQGEDSSRGQLWVNGPNNMLGYDHNGSGLVLRQEKLFYPTGDEVERMLDGSIRFHGRRDGLIKVYGYRVHPLELEEALIKCTGKSQWIAIGLSHPQAGSALVALFEGEQLPAPQPEILALLKEQLGSASLPFAFQTIRKFPTSSNGKIDRRALSEEFANLFKNP